MNKDEVFLLNDNDSLSDELPQVVDNKQKHIAAIDIGTTKIVAIIGSVSENGKVSILGMGKSVSKGVRRGIVLNIDETANAIKDAVAIAQKQSKLNFHEVYVGIAGQHIKSMKNNGSISIQANDGEITQEDVDRLIAEMYNVGLENGEEIIHVIPQSYTVDKEVGVKQPIGMFGNRLHGNFHIVIGESAAVKYMHKSVERAGLKIKGLILEPLASASAVITEDEKEVGVAIIDIGGGTTDMAVYYDGILRHTAVIPFGGDIITRDIRDATSIIYRQAEKLKVQFGTALGDAAPDNHVVSVPGVGGREPKKISVKFLSKIIQARMEEIIDVIYFELENSGYFKKLGAGITITGGGAMLTYLKQLLSFKTTLDVNIGYPHRYLETDNDNINLPMYSTSIGLLLTGYLSQKNGLCIDTNDEENIEEQFEEQVDEEQAEDRGLVKKFGKIFKEIFDDKGSRM